jgi:hypothetical protein
MVIDTAARAAMDRVFGKKPTGEPSREADALSALLAAQGFVAVRTLAEREGLIFVEGIEKSL